MELHRIPSLQVADKNANTNFQGNLSLDLFDTNLEELKFRFSRGGFDTAVVENFLQYGSFPFKFGRLESGVRNNSPKFHQVFR